MGLSTIKRFNSNHWIKLLKYSLGSRLVNSVPKGLKSTYDFIVLLERKSVNYKKENNLFRFQYPVNKKVFDFYVAQDSSDTLVFNQIVFEKEYDSLIDLFNEKNISLDNMIDAGANIGLTSIYFKAYYPNLKIIALEPSKDTFKRLSINIEKNDLSRVTLLQKGLWNKTTRLKEDRTFRDGQDWSFRLVEANEKEEVLFETTTVPEILMEYGIGVIDFLKMDIEGGEKTIFEGSSDLSWLKKVKVIAIEIHDEFNCRNQVEASLINAGFEITYSGELTIGVNKILCNQ